MADILDTKPLIGDITYLGDEMLKQILWRHEAAYQKVTGETSRTLRIIPSDSGFKLYGWKYAGTYEEGRKPGKMPPTDVLLAWARAKHIEFKSESQARSWAYGLALRIAREGTKRYQFAQMGKPVDVFTTPINEMRSKLEKLVTRFYADSISKELLRTDLKN